MDYLHQLIAQDNLQFFGLNETWLNNSISSSFLTSRSHLIIRQDRRDARGGGVALFYNSLFRSTIVASHLDFFTGVEFLLTESAFSQIESILHLIVYRPPNINKNCLIIVFNHLRPLVVECSRYIFCGDLNLDLANPANLAFVDELLTSHGLARISFGPTHFTSSSQSEIDVMAFGGNLDLLRHSASPVQFAGPQQRNIITFFIIIYSSNFDF